MSNANKTIGQKLLGISIDGQKLEGNRWDLSGELVLGCKAAIEGTEGDVNAIRNIVNDAWTKDVDKEVPLEGENCKGDVVVLRHDGKAKGLPEGQVKFRAWKTTATTAKGISTITQGVATLGFDVVFPDGKLIGKTELEQLVKEGKPTEAAYKAIKRGLDLVASRITDLEDVTEMAEIDALFSKTMFDYTTHCNEVRAKAQKVAA